MKTAKEMFDSVMEKKDVQIAKAKARKALAWKLGAGVGCLALVCALAFGLQKDPAPKQEEKQMASNPATKQTIAPTQAAKPQATPNGALLDVQPEPATKPAVKPTAAPAEKPTASIVKPTTKPVVKPTMAAPVVRPATQPVQPTVARPTQAITPTQAVKHYKILLDVNPSIELEVDSSDKITHVTFLNEDGQKILGDSALPGMKAAEGVAFLVEEMVDQGYISSEANSVLVSVAGAEKEKADAVKEELTEKIADTLSEKNVEGAILMQELSEEEAAKDTAVDGISAGKAKLIEQILAQNSLHTYEELAAMTIHQLNVLHIEYYVNLENMEISGTPSLLAYIGKDEAIRIAQATGEAKAELTCKAGVMVYIVEFENETHEYRYQINAVTGEILKAEESELGKNDFFQGDTPVATVGEKAALAAALQHAGVENGKLIRCKCKSDWVDGKVIYEIYFTDGLTNGSYTINARTGEILKYTKGQEPRDRSIKVPVIGEAQAKAIAMAKDGLVDGNISKYEMNLKQTGESYVYEMMFLCNGVRYTAEIAAADGAVVSFTREVLAETGRAPAEGGGNKPSAEETQKPAGELAKPVPETESNKPGEEGDRPAAEEGSKPTVEGDKGDQPAESEGNNASAEEG